jgi:N-acetylglucosaminyl-diphospho-decaprenol L-rhamnosyltransferase
VTTAVDVVVVSYNSANELRDCVEPLSQLEGVSVIVVDNASRDASLSRIADLPVKAIPRDTNDGFAAGCNAGWVTGSAPYVLFLNPDASIDENSLGLLVSALESDGSAGAVAPRIEHPDGSLVFSLRRCPRLCSTFSRALFLHRVFPLASWSDEIVRDPSRYRAAHEPEWVSGACILVRRDALEELRGWDEGYFLYREDADLCRRLSQSGRRIRFEPTARALHVGGASAPRAALLPVLVDSRLRYARKFGSPLNVLLNRLGLALGSATHVVVSRGGLAVRTGHARALLRCFRCPARPAR